MDLYEILLQRLVLLTDEYLQLKERVKELENDCRIKNSTAPRIVKMRIEKHREVRDFGPTLKLTPIDGKG